MRPIKVDLQRYVQIALILWIGLARNRSRHLLALANGYRFVQVEDRLLPMRVLCERRGGKSQRFVHAREGAFEVRYEAVDVIPTLGAQPKGRREGQVRLGAFLQIDVQYRHRILCHGRL